MSDETPPRPEPTDQPYAGSGPVVPAASPPPPPWPPRAEAVPPPSPPPGPPLAGAVPPPGSQAGPPPMAGPSPAVNGTGRKWLPLTAVGVAGLILGLVIGAVGFGLVSAFAGHHGPFGRGDDRGQHGQFDRGGPRDRGPFGR